MEESTIATLKATAPIVKEHGTAITKAMYRILFDEYPSVKNYFNMSHFREDREGVMPQAQALADAVFMYAQHADDLGKLGHLVGRMTHKHISFHVLPEHYDVVGECLLKAMKEVLADGLTDDVAAEWAKGYKFLADLLIGIEKGMYKTSREQEGGWEGYKPLKLTRKEAETDRISSFYFESADGQPLPTFKAGQYVAFQVPGSKLADCDLDFVVRNYNMSNKPGQGYYKFTVKKEVGDDAKAPPGQVSTYFHDRLQVGDEVMTSVPCGQFVLKPGSTKPVVLIAGGIGITPLLSMLEQLVEENQAKTNPDEKRLITFIYAARTHAFKPYIDSLANPELKNNMTTCISHTVDELAGITSLRYARQFKGMLTAKRLIAMVPYMDSDFYFCGPPNFMEDLMGCLLEMDVPEDQIYQEFFGPAREMNKDKLSKRESKFRII